MPRQPEAAENVGRRSDNTEIYALALIAFGAVNGYWYSSELYEYNVLSGLLLMYLFVGKVTYDGLRKAHQAYDSWRFGLSLSGVSMMVAPVLYLYVVEDVITVGDAALVLAGIPVLGFAGYRIYKARKLHNTPWLDMGVGELGVALIFLTVFFRVAPRVISG